MKKNTMNYCSLDVSPYCEPRSVSVTAIIARTPIVAKIINFISFINSNYSVFDLPIQIKIINIICARYELVQRNFNKYIIDGTPIMNIQKSSINKS
jgi:hypothetical protein